MRVLAIDPGNEYSAAIIIEGKNIITRHYVDNVDMRDLMMSKFMDITDFDIMAIEMIASFGMAVGQTVFDTCLWIGRFIELCELLNKPWVKVYRKKNQDLIPRLPGTFL